MPTDLLARLTDAEVREALFEERRRGDDRGRLAYQPSSRVVKALYAGETTEWLAPNALAVPWWRIL